jgi:hypothetical protein
MNWCRHLTPWPEHLQPWLNTPEEPINAVPPRYLTPKENMVEENVDTGIKSPDPEGMKRRRDSEPQTVAMVVTTPPPYWAGHYKERWVFDPDARAHIIINHMYMYNLCPTK